MGAQFHSCSLTLLGDNSFAPKHLGFCGLQCLLQSRMWVWRGMRYIKTVVPRSVRGRWHFWFRSSSNCPEEERESEIQKEKQTAPRLLRDSSTRSRQSEDTSFHTDKIQRGLQDAFSPQNVEAPTCGLVPCTHRWRSPREAPGACPGKQGAGCLSQHGSLAVQKSL